MMDDDERARPEAPRSAEWAVALGVAALVCAVLPVVGDWIAVPVGVGAVALGSVGIRVAERDGRPGIARGLVGAMLGLVAVGAALFSVAAGLGHADAG
ncbi:hypothetical protein [Isoptericola cucumis]|uniref:hypothetical protein n=1 Tax=Isoptericola cucumis TaxID=1776856 RepID=UPI0016642C38|nr:hypothetical protein [Isoptericola cucumis]